MNTHLTEIAFVLDRSGSMSGCLDSTISGFNEFLATQKDQPGLARFTLALFDDRYEVPYFSIPISEVTDLDHRTFVPRGSTALLDAIGRTIDELGHRLAALTEQDRPGMVIVAILTDGEENASRNFTWVDVSSRIRHQTEVYQWIFLFLGAGPDAIATAGRMNIAAQNAACYAADGVGSMTTFRSSSRLIAAQRRKSQGKATEKDLSLLETSFGDLVAEDDREERGEPRESK